MTIDDQLRLRSDAELEIQNEGLIIIKEKLTKIGIKHFLSSGTLLGAVRDKNFIRWDWDVQMYLLREDAYPFKEKITKSLIEAGFTIDKYDNSKESLKWVLIKKNVVYELTAWSLEGKWRYRRNKTMKVPAYLFEGKYIINFKGTDYPTLNPPEEYLEFCYGDWQTPKRTSNKEIYSNSTHLSDYKKTNKYFNLIKKNIVKFLKNFNLFQQK